MRWRLPLIVSGSILILVPILAPLIASRMIDTSPGKLVPRHETLRWHCPPPSQAGGHQVDRPAFEVLNVGGSPVHILSVVTGGCSCVTARAEPQVVPPKGRAAIVVDADPFEVGKREAHILLETDAPASREIRLKLLLEGYRYPPYILEVVGELFYPGGYSSREAREVTVKTVEPEGLSGTLPRISSDLPFLRVGAPEVSVERTDSSRVVRTYRYPITFGVDPPPDPFTGRVSVVDPWNPERVTTMIVHGEAHRAIQAFPSRLSLVLAGPQDIRSSVRFSVRSNSEGSGLSAEVEGGENSPLIVEAKGKHGDEGLDFFEVRCKPGKAVTGGIFNIIVRSKSSATAVVTVPVFIRVREA